VDFLERIFHLDLDGGSGALELLYAGVVVVAGVAFTQRGRLVRGVSRLVSHLRRTA
jgi:hypothetical protein